MAIVMREDFLQPYGAEKKERRPLLPLRDAFCISLASHLLLINVKPQQKLSLEQPVPVQATR